MMARLSFPGYIDSRLGILVALTCIAFVLNAAVYAVEHRRPALPRAVQVYDDWYEEEIPEPLPLSPPSTKRSPLLQRPQTQQVVFDDLDPLGSVVTQPLIYDEDYEPPIIRQRAVSTRSIPARNASPAAMTLENDFTIFTDEGMIVNDHSFARSSLLNKGSFQMGSCDADYYADGCYSVSSFPVPFGMGFFDNITAFTETTSFKTGLSGGVGSFGISEGLNWSAAVSPQGTLTAQYGVRAVQADLYSRPVRSQLYMTAGLFKRFDRLPIQGGVAFDWLEDRTRYFGLVKLRQMRCELSTRLFDNTEFGFTGAFNVFNDHPIVWNAELPEVMGVFDTRAYDYCMLFFRKYLDNGGQVELRCGATTYGDFMMNLQGEVAVSDRIAFNAGIAFLAPQGSSSDVGEFLESWSLSMGVVIYLRGGAVFRQANQHRAMFNVAGNDSFVTQAVFW